MSMMCLHNPSFLSAGNQHLHHMSLTSSQNSLRILCFRYHPRLPLLLCHRRGYWTNCSIKTKTPCTCIIRRGSAHPVHLRRSRRGQLTSPVQPVLHNIPLESQTGRNLILPTYQACRHARLRCRLHRCAYPILKSTGPSLFSCRRLSLRRHSPRNGCLRCCRAP